MATYRCAHHHPVIPMARAENLESHIKPQRKTGSGNRERYELDDDEGRAPGLGVDVIRGRPRGHDLRRWEPHTFGRGGVPCVAVAVGSNHKHQGSLPAPANGHGRHVRAGRGLLFGWKLPTSRPRRVVLEPRQRGRHNSGQSGPTRGSEIRGKQGGLYMYRGTWRMSVCLSV